MLAALAAAAALAAPADLACSREALAGEWRAPDGLTVRFEGPFGEGQPRAVVVRAGTEPATADEVMYDKVRKAADCRFLVRRHLFLNLDLHPSPPHIVALELDPAAGTLTDDYQGEDLVFTRVGP